jgi:putative multiple sugar transport system ATP-binding protein
MANTHVLEMSGIQKTFPGVKALDHVDLRVAPGQIHAVVGENGAGKSTLMKVLSGVYPYGSYSGEIHFLGVERRFAGVADSERAGIVIIHQELALVPLLSITENLYLGNEQARHGVIDWGAAHARARKLLVRVGLSEAPTTIVSDLGVGKQQLVEIAKALSKNVKLLILDEPTASLNESDSAALLALLLELKAEGIASILISHKLNEISQVADAITVLRDGSSVATLDCRKETISEDQIIRSMVGRDMAERYPPRTPNIGAPLFEVQDWRVHHHQHAGRAVVKGVNFNVRKGEIVGIAGLMGAGRTELAMSIFGRSYGQRISGRTLMHGQQVDLGTVQKAIGHGVAYVTEDRKGCGLLLAEDITRNVTLANLPAVARHSVIDDGREHGVAKLYRNQFRIRCANVQQQVGNLSGGNQQKVMLGKWLFTNPQLLMLDEPSRGIDVGAKYEIYSIINALADEGKGIVMISSEMPELLGMCDRIYVMNEGQLVAELSAREATQEKIMRAIIKNGEY